MRKRPLSISSSSEELESDSEEDKVDETVEARVFVPPADQLNAQSAEAVLTLWTTHVRQLWHQTPLEQLVSLIAHCSLLDPCEAFAPFYCALLHEVCASTTSTKAFLATLRQHTVHPKVYALNALFVSDDDGSTIAALRVSTRACSHALVDATCLAHRMPKEYRERFTDRACAVLQIMYTTDSAAVLRYVKHLTTWLALSATTHASSEACTTLLRKLFSGLPPSDDMFLSLKSLFIQLESAIGTSSKRVDTYLLLVRSVLPDDALWPVLEVLFQSSPTPSVRLAVLACMRESGGVAKTLLAFLSDTSMMDSSDAVRAAALDWLTSSDNSHGSIKQRIRVAAMKTRDISPTVRGSATKFFNELGVEALVAALSDVEQLVTARALLLACACSADVQLSLRDMLVNLGMLHIEHIVAVRGILTYCSFKLLVVCVVGMCITRECEESVSNVLHITTAVEQLDVAHLLPHAEVRALLIDAIRSTQCVSAAKDEK